jgi:hypothetical protein
MGAIIARKILKLGATLYGAYWITGSILGHCTVRTAPGTHIPADPAPEAAPEIRRLEIYTDGAVILKPSSDKTIKVSHEWGANTRSALNQIKFKETFNRTDQTLTIEGLLGAYQQTRFEQFVARFFKVRPKRILRHIVEVPASILPMITTGNSDNYIQDGEPTVQADSIAARNVSIYSYGDVTTRNTGQEAIEQQTEVHTPGTVTAIDFLGNLRIVAPHLHYTRPVQNLRGKVSHNGVEHPLLMTYEGQLL